MAARATGGLQAREIAWIVVAALAVAAAALWVVSRLADPAPPTSFVITTASKGAPYHTYATQYAPIFARNGIRLEVRESLGSMDNIARLTAPQYTVDAGFVQGGLVSSRDTPGLVSLGRIAYEPLWVFYNGEKPLERLGDLVGKRVLVGPAGGGTNGLALRLLKANGVTGENATLINRELPDYVDILARGEADAGFLVLAPEARTVQRLLRTTGVKLMSFANADAYTQKFPFLSRLELREGVVDLGARIPPEDTTLLATTIAVLAREDAHPALVNLLAQAIVEVHGKQGLDAQGDARLFHRAGEFPSANDPEFALSDDARRVYRSGPPFLQRYVPFWLATLIDRLLVSLVVVVPLLIPAMRFAPAIYRWRIRRRIVRWYGVLQEVESEARNNPSPAERQRALADLDRIEAAVDETAVPLAFADQLYHLRAHIMTVRSRLMAIGHGTMAGDVSGHVGEPRRAHPELPTAPLDRMT